MKDREQWGTSMSSSAARAHQTTASRASASTASRQASPSKFVAVLGFSMTLAAVSVAIASLEWPADPQPAAIAKPVALSSDPVSQPTAAVQPAPLPAPATTQPASAAAPPIPAPPPPAYVPAPAPLQPTQCSSQPLRKFYVAGSGTIRIYSSGYISQVVTLGPYPQEVAFPIARPASGPPVPDTVVVEGRAGTVIMTTDVRDFRQVISNLRGSQSFDLRWLPLRTC
jgi:hypothetical protein